MSAQLCSEILLLASKRPVSPLPILLAQVTDLVPLLGRARLSNTHML